ncbi:MAG: putative nitrogen fixation protein NifT [Leptolyngbyaceae cyanobacterium]
MKVMLHKDQAGNLSVYVPKKDLEEEVVEQAKDGDARIFTLANGWKLSVSGLADPLELPKTVQAKRLD